MQQYSQIIFLVVIVGAFYLLLIRPQQQQAKKQAEMVSKLTPDTEIMTVGGMYATIVEVEDDRVRVRVADGTELEFAKRAVSTIVKPRIEAATEDEEADSEEADAEQAHSEESDSSSVVEPPIDGGFTPAGASETKDDAPDA